MWLLHCECDILILFYCNNPWRSYLSFFLNPAQWQLLCRLVQRHSLQSAEAAEKPKFVKLRKPKAFCGSFKFHILHRKPARRIEEHNAISSLGEAAPKTCDSRRWLFWDAAINFLFTHSNWWQLKIISSGPAKNLVTFGSWTACRNEIQGPSCSRFSPAPSSESYWKAINRQDREREPHCSTPRSRKVGCLWGPISRDCSWVPGTRSPVNQGATIARAAVVAPEPRGTPIWTPAAEWEWGESFLHDRGTEPRFSNASRGKVPPEWDLSIMPFLGTTVVAEENAGTPSKISVWDGKMFHSHFIKCCK